MVRLCQVEKARTTFRHPDRDDVTVVIDLIAGVGAFAETEVMAVDRMRRRRWWTWWNGSSA